MSDAELQPAAQAAKAGVVEIPLSKQRPFTPHIILWFVVVVSIVAVVVEFTSNKSIAMLVAFATIILFDVTVESLARRHIARLQIPSPTPAGMDEPALSSVFQDYVSQYPARFPPLTVTLRLIPSSLSSLASALIKAGYRGTTICLSAIPIDGRRTPDPVRHTFEPLRVFPPDREALERITTPSTRLEQLSEFLEIRRGSFRTARFSRVAILALIVLGLALQLIGLIFGVFELLSHRVPSILSKFMDSGILNFAILFLFLAAMARPEQWFLTPQSLVIRESSRFAMTWRVHQFRRDSSVLLYWPDMTLLTVAGANGRAFSCMCAPKSAEAIFHGWLCDQPPPSEALLEDFRQ